MKKDSVYVVFDRKKKVAGDGEGTVDVVVYLNRNQRKYISMGMCKRSEWEELAKKKHVQNTIEHCKKVLDALAVLKLEVNTENFNTYYYKDEETAKAAPTTLEHVYKGHNLDENFIDYFADEVEKEQIRESTRKHKRCTVRALQSFGKIKTFRDLTPANIILFDDWLRDGTRSEVSIYSYHKNLKKVLRKLKMRDMIPENPYDKVSLKRGKCKEREPLTEKELSILMALRLEGKLARVRDLFIFCAYTGLSYGDMIAFNFKDHAVKEGSMYFIDGKRIKTGNKFFTPILKPAMEILKKYNYELPHISDQKGNDYLRLIRALLGFSKKLTFHVARHSFATLVLAHDVPIENLARMLGHSDIRTTQIYAKVLKTTIERHAETLNNGLLLPGKFNSISPHAQSITR